jgi:hypothetical protein
MMFPTAAPNPCAPIRGRAGSPNRCAVACWKSVNRMFDAVAEPVTNVPSTPTNGANRGHRLPAATAAAAAGIAAAEEEEGIAVAAEETAVAAAATGAAEANALTVPRAPAARRVAVRSGICRIRRPA